MLLFKMNQCICVQCHTRRVFWHTFFLKLMSGWYPVIPKIPLWLRAECRKIIDIRFICVRIFMSFKNIFISEVSAIYFIQFFKNGICGNNVGKTCYACPYLSNGIKITYYQTFVLMLNFPTLFRQNQIKQFYSCPRN